MSFANDVSFPLSVLFVRKSEYGQTFIQVGHAITTTERNLARPLLSFPLLHFLHLLFLSLHCLFMCPHLKLVNELGLLRENS